MQYKLKESTRWKQYPGKSNIDRPVSLYDWRLLNKGKTEVLWPTNKPSSTYKDVLSNLRRIEFFKHRNQGSRLDEEFDYFPSGEKIPGRLKRRLVEEVERIEMEKRNQGSLKRIFKNYKTNRRGGQHYHTYNSHPQTKKEIKWARLMIRVDKEEITPDQAVEEYLIEDE